MASELGYGQPMGGIAQTAFIVPNLHEAIGRWVTDMRAGPFFVLPNFLVPGQTYRGEESRADITIAMGFAGHMLIELIQPLDDKPSIYKEMRERSGYGFHHVAKIRSDVRQLAKTYEAKGQATVFHSPTPGGGEVFFVEGGEHAPGYIELVEDCEPTRAIFEHVWRASLDWKGDRPVRDFLELLK